MFFSKLPPHQAAVISPVSLFFSKFIPCLHSSPQQGTRSTPGTKNSKMLSGPIQVSCSIEQRRPWPLSLAWTLCLRSQAVCPFHQLPYKGPHILGRQPSIPNGTAFETFAWRSDDPQPDIKNNGTQPNFPRRNSIELVPKLSSPSDITSADKGPQGPCDPGMTVSEC